VGYTAVRGGLQAIESAAALVDAMPVNSESPVGIEQIERHLQIAVCRVMSEGGLVDPQLAALAIKQAEGDVIEAAFLLRAYRSTLPRLGYSHAVSGREMLVLRRVSSVFRDMPGGQVLGLTRDYTQRLLNFGLLDGAKRNGAGANASALGDPSGAALTLTLSPRERGSEEAVVSKGQRGLGAALSQRDVEWIGAAPETVEGESSERGGNQSSEQDGREVYPNVINFLREEGLMAPAPEGTPEDEPFDVTRTPPVFPMPRSGWLQVLARGEAGSMLMLAYSSMRGWGGTGHGAIAELRYGELPVRISHPVTGRAVTIGHVEACEVHYVAGGFASLQESAAADYQMGYGLVVGRDERKAISMSIIDCSLRFATPGDAMPVANQEFVVSHVDSVESSGFVEHLKLPHYVTFQAGLQRFKQWLASRSLHMSTVRRCTATRTAFSMPFRNARSDARS
jgi:alpha-D-ribose 1-methylphosphonate 5-triphosphate synthase subunit PhnI